MVILSPFLSASRPLSRPVLHRRRYNSQGKGGGGGGEINGVQRWGASGAMEIAEGAVHKKAAKCVRQKEIRVGCAP